MDESKDVAIYDKEKFVDEFYTNLWVGGLPGLSGMINLDKTVENIWDYIVRGMVYKYDNSMKFARERTIRDVIQLVKKQNDQHKWWIENTEGFLQDLQQLKEVKDEG